MCSSCQYAEGNNVGREHDAHVMPAREPNSRQHEGIRYFLCVTVYARPLTFLQKLLEDWRDQLQKNETFFEQGDTKCVPISIPQLLQFRKQSHIQTENHHKKTHAVPSVGNCMMSLLSIQGVFGRGDLF
jgi:cysteinyl-tRNA synthetase